MEDIDFGVDFLLVKIQTNLHKNCVWKEKSVEPSMCPHWQIKRISILKMWKKIKECVHTWANEPGYYA